MTEQLLTCDYDPNNPRKVTRGACRDSHIMAIRYAIIRMKTGKLPEFSPCLKCPTGISLLTAPIAPDTTDQVVPQTAGTNPENSDQEVKMPSPYIQSQCKECGKSGSIFKHSRICQKCLKKPSGQVVVAKPSPPKKAPASTETVVEKKPPMPTSSEPGKVDFLLPILEKEADLYNKLRHLCQKERRTLEQQIMWIIEKAVMPDQEVGK